MVCSRYLEEWIGKQYHTTVEHVYEVLDSQRKIDPETFRSCVIKMY